MSTSTQRTWIWVVHSVDGSPPRVTKLPLLPSSDELPELRPVERKSWIDRLVAWVLRKPPAD
jgi:hypothetical protein